MRTFHTGGVAGSDITQGLPRIQEIFEARNPKGQAVITEIEGVVEDIKLAKDRQQEIVVKGANETRSYLASGTSRLKVEVGQSVERGEVLTEGSIEPKNFLAVAGLNATESYLLKEVQKVYRMQGVEIDDKHVEVMVRQMLRKVRIIELVILSYYLVHWLTFIALQMQTEKRLKNVNVQQLLNQYCLVLQKRLLKLKASYQQHHSKKQLVYLQMQQLKVNATTYLDLKKTLLLVS